MLRFVTSYPDVKNEILDMLSFSENDLNKELDELPLIIDDNIYKLSQKRLNFIKELILTRKDILYNKIQQTL